MPPFLPNLVYRLQKGSPLTSAEIDNNFRTLANGVNGLSALQSVVLNPDGTLKPGAVNNTNVLADRIVTTAKRTIASQFFAVAGGTPDDITIAFAPVTTNVTYIAGEDYWIQIALPNTGAVTLNVDGRGAKSVVKMNGNAMTLGDLNSGDIILVVYNGTQFVMVNALPVAPFFTALTTNESNGTGTALGASDTKVGECTFTLPAGKTWRWIELNFSTLVTDNGGALAGIGDFKVKIAGVTMPWVMNTRAGDWLVTDNDADNFQVSWRAEGEPTGYLQTTPLAVELYASFGGGAVGGDDPGHRKIYGVAQYR